MNLVIFLKVALEIKSCPLLEPFVNTTSVIMKIPTNLQVHVLIRDKWQF